MIIDGESLAFVPKDSADNVFCDVSRVADLKVDVTGAPVYIGNGCDAAQWNSTDLKGKIVVTDQTGYPEVRCLARDVGRIAPSHGSFKRARSTTPLKIRE
jgi:hypothetical protein